MKKKEDAADDDLRPEYDLAPCLRGAEQGRYAERFRQGNQSPEDDEPESAEEAAAVEEAWREHSAGKSLTTEELKRVLGLS
jgi:hypothetical protein